MKEDFSELVQYLDQKFTHIEDRFDVVDRRFDEVKQDFVNLQTSVDAYAVKADTYFQEMAALTTKVDRLERWIQEVAGKIGVELKP